MMLKSAQGIPFAQVQIFSSVLPDPDSHLCAIFLLVGIFITVMSLKIKGDHGKEKLELTAPLETPPNSYVYIRCAPALLMCRICEGVYLMTIHILEACMTV